MATTCQCGCCQNPTIGCTCDTFPTDEQCDCVFCLAALRDRDRRYLSAKERKMLMVALMSDGPERRRLESTIFFSSNDEQDQAYVDLLDRLRKGA